ncbi:MAG: hypothetical protein N4A65_09350 [Cohaesibacter sp.]|jgi:hypothetical protein|nr:hypothetical protein [Cohaesibacter sp.]
MMRLMARYGTLGLVLTMFGMMSLVLVGGSFGHAHEIAGNGADHHSIRDGDNPTDHHHDHESHVDRDGSLHCGSSILSLVSLQNSLPTGIKERVNGALAPDLIARILAPEPPPPRLA